MSCNCKKKRELDELQKNDGNRGFFANIWLFILRTLFFILMLVISIVTIPILVLYIIYKVSFTNGGAVVLPKFLGKYLKD